MWNTHKRKRNTLRISDIRIFHNNNIVLLQLYLYWSWKYYTEPFFLLTQMSLSLENQPPLLKQKGCIYTTFRGLTASLGDSPPQRYFTTYNITKIRESWAHITMTQRNYYIKMVASATLSENHNFSLTIWFLYLMLSGGEGTLTTASPVAATCCWRKTSLLCCSVLAVLSH